MSTRIIFTSVRKPDKWAYELCSDYSFLFDRRGQAPLSAYVSCFETYGDGLCKHSHSWVPQFAEVCDVCLSIVTAYVADPTNEAWQMLPYMVADYPEDLLRFVLSIRHCHDWDKPHYYNTEQRKISASESKRCDRRWVKIEPWMDGSCAAGLNIILGERSSDWLSRLCLADDLRRLANYPSWEQVFKPAYDLGENGLEKEHGDWHQAFGAFRAAVRAHVALDYARRAMSAVLAGNTKRMDNPEPEPVKNKKQPIGFEEMKHIAEVLAEDSKPIIVGEIMRLFEEADPRRDH